MALRFYFDSHIAKAAAVQLREKGVDVVRCEDVGMADASDETLLQYATDYLVRPVQGEAQISHVVKELLFHDESERAGALDYESEIENQIVYF